MNIKVREPAAPRKAENIVLHQTIFSAFSFPFSLPPPKSFKSKFFLYFDFQFLTGTDILHLIFRDTIPSHDILI